MLALGASNQPQIYPKLKAALSQPAFMALAWLTSELMAAEQWGTHGIGSDYSSTLSSHERELPSSRAVEWP